MKLHVRLVLLGVAVMAFTLHVARPTLLCAAGIPIDLRSSAGTAVTASSFYDEGGGNDNHPAKASNWSGITGTFPDGVASTDWWTSWASAGHGDLNYTNEWIAWDLGATYTLSKVHVWNYNEGGYTNEGLKNLDIQKWNSETLAWENAYTGLTWNKAPDSPDYAGFDQEFTAPITTSRIRFANLANFGGGGAEYGAGVGEVVFYAVPEPGTMALLSAAGLGLLICARRWRRAA